MRQFDQNNGAYGQTRIRQSFEKFLGQADWDECPALNQEALTTLRQLVWAVGQPLYLAIVDAQIQKRGFCIEGVSKLFYIRKKNLETCILSLSLLLFTGESRFPVRFESVKQEGGQAPPTRGSFNSIQNNDGISGRLRSIIAVVVKKSDRRF